MRTFTLLSLMVFSLAASAQVLYDNFDDVRTLDYGFINGEFFPYVANPSPDGVNGSPVVAQYFRNPVELFDVILTNPGTLADIGDYISGAKQMTMDVLAPGPGIVVQITLEDSVAAMPTNYPTGRRAEFQATTTGSGWETLTFGLTAQPDASVPNTGVNSAVILFNPNATVNQEWYFDNVRLPESSTPLCDGAVDSALLYMDAECDHDLSITFTHGRLRRVVNPDASGANTSPYALRYDRNVGELDDVVVGDFPAALDPEDGTMMFIDVYDVNAPSVYALGIQNSAGVDVIAVLDSTAPSDVNTWTTLEFDLSGAMGVSDVTKFVLLYKPGNFLNGRTFIDNWRQENPEGVGFLNPASFETLEAWPNPASDRFVVRVPEGMQDGALQVFDPAGRLVHQQASFGTDRMELSSVNWADGLYTVRWQSGDRLAIQRIAIAH
jgi:hypothetical protein